jgi:hypothetical protein
MFIYRNPGFSRKVYLNLLCLYLLFIVCPTSLANELINVNIHDEVYTFIKRLVVRGLIDDGLYNTQPISRREVAEALLEVSEKHRNGQVKLTDVEKEHLERFQWLFSYEINQISPGFLDRTKRNHAVTIEGEDYKIDLDLKVNQEVAVTENLSQDWEFTSITSPDVSLLGKLGPYLGVYSIFHPRALIGSDIYNPYKTEVVFPDQLEFYTGIMSMEGYVVLSFPWASLQWGLENNWWGPGWHGALMLSDNSAPKDSLKLCGTYGPFKFTYLTSVLRDYKPFSRSLRDEYTPRYMSAHRIEVMLYPGINFAFNEVMLFVDRYELRYLNPFIIFQSMQAQDAKDNAFLGFDFDINLPPSLEFYGEVMIDDFIQTFEENPFRVWASKYGVLVGGYWADPLGLPDVDLRAEYALVNQYAYTHMYGITNYTHQGNVIGHWIGTDADDLWISAGHWVNDNLHIFLRSELERQGEGDVSKRYPLDVPQDEKPVGIEPPRYWEFLSGVEESTYSFSIGMSYTSLGKYSTSVEYIHSRIRDFDHQIGINKNINQVLVKAYYRF